ncbi:YhjD/YihY/BrkB family envelope integrity protein [Spirillospora sp. NPDC052269]
MSEFESVPASVPRPRTGNDTAAGAPSSGAARRARPVWLGTALRTAWELARATVVTAFRYRVTGLAAEAAFFALLSLPPLVIGLVGMMGHVKGVLGAETIGEIRTWTIHRAENVLTGPAVKGLVVPLIDDVLRGGRPDVVSVSFLISLWAGSRATNVYVDTITITYGLSGVRGVIRTRLRAFFLYLLGVVLLSVVIPLLVAGPALARQAVPRSSGVVEILYWPVVTGVSVIFLALLYHHSIPVRTAWWRELPGAVVALLIWIVGSFLLRFYLAGSLRGISVYGSLAASIAVLGWLYVAALAVLLGAALNSEIDRRWPSAGTSAARARATDPPDGPSPEGRNIPGGSIPDTGR